jgi:hypothetical protein
MTARMLVTFLTPVRLVAARLKDLDALAAALALQQVQPWSPVCNGT